MGLVVRLSKGVFSKEAILKVAYLHQENFNIIISEDDNNYLLNIESKISNVEFDVQKFNGELQEQQLREMLNQQFGALRDSIYNKAFEHFTKQT